MKNSEPSIKQPSESRYSTNRLLVDVSFVVAMATGIGHSVIKTWDMFYDNWKNNPIFASAKKERDDAKVLLTQDAVDKKIDYHQFTERSEKIEKAWGKEFNRLAKDHLKIESEGLGAIKGTWQRFHSLGNYTRNKIVFGTVLSTAASIGGYMLINQNAHMKKDLNATHAQALENSNEGQQR